jgi:hypothetical protein
MPSGAVASELAKEGKKNTIFFNALAGFGITGLQYGLGVMANVSVGCQVVVTFLSRLANCFRCSIASGKSR